MPPEWIYDAAFYHIYPLGLCGAPEYNDFITPPVNRLDRLSLWIDHIVSLHLNAVYLGPVFESTAHGYDVADYHHVDRRLGTNDTLRTLISNMKSRGLRVVLDGVFNHVGRDFPAFKDVQMNRQASRYATWFYKPDFNRTSPYGDSFSYEGWAGHYDLVKLNLHNADVRQHLFGAVEFWIREFDIDGLRLDAADHLDLDFLRDLAQHCRAIKPDFWLMGEVVHGDYRRWVAPDLLDATTNYECYKGLYSSHVDRNYFEIAYSLNRQFGREGIYRDLLLYSFADNHDVNRVASSLTEAAHLYPLYILLFTMPGIPSIYNGSEWGLEGKRTASDDKALRPRLQLDTARKMSPHPDLAATIGNLATLRHELSALRYGSYQQVHVNHQQFAFLRETADETVLVAVNSADNTVTLCLNGLSGQLLRDRLNHNRVFRIEQHQAIIELHPDWGSIFVME